MQTSEHVQIGRYCGICGVHVGRLTATCSGQPITGEEVERVEALKEHPDWLHVEIAELRAKLEAAEGEAERIMAANDVPEMYGVGQRRAAERLLAILSEGSRHEPE